jgi:hypothetical protein
MADDIGMYVFGELKTNRESMRVRFGVVIGQKRDTGRV